MPFSKSVTTLVFGCLLLALASYLAGRPLWSPTDNTLVVYCAHDAEYSEPILKEFERQTGIRILPRFDTEATKSLGLINLLIQEQQQPRCDVFWNNELAGMLDLQARDILAPYQGTGFARIPAQYKDPSGYWTGFAARMRVHIVNTTLQSSAPDAIDDLWKSGDLQNVAMAKPLYGTTLVHYSVLTDLWGLEQVQAWHHETRRRGLREVDGNATVKNLVARGACRTGLTDTDDFFVALDAGQPVKMQPVRVGPQGQTICIPNSVALIRGSRHRQAAEQLIDFLLSAEIELRLSQSAARQIPLGPVDSKKLSAEVRELARWAQEGYDLRGLFRPRRACVDWLSSLYLQTRSEGASPAAEAGTIRPGTTDVSTTGVSTTDAGISDTGTSGAGTVAP